MDQKGLSASIKVLKDSFAAHAKKEKADPQTIEIVSTGFDLLENLLSDIKSISDSLTVLANNSWI
jgi:hypothetical protein